MLGKRESVVTKKGAFLKLPSDGGRPAKLAFTV